MQRRPERWDCGYVLPFLFEDLRLWNPFCCSNILVVVQQQQQEEEEQSEEEEEVFVYECCCARVEREMSCEERWLDFESFFHVLLIIPWGKNHLTKCMGENHGMFCNP